MSINMIFYNLQKIYRGLPVESWGKIDNVINFIHEIYFKQVCTPIIDKLNVGSHWLMNENVDIKFRFLE